MDDTISRKAAIDALTRKMVSIPTAGEKDLMDDVNRIRAEDISVIKRLPSAQPETHEERTETHACDCIERQAAIDALDKEYRCTDKSDDWDGLKTAMLIIENLPSAQPIIRCKDCKHQVKEWRADKRLKDKGYMVCGCDVVGDACGYWALLGQDDDYCSMAERRPDESDANT